MSQEMERQQTLLLILKIQTFQFKLLDLSLIQSILYKIKSLCVQIILIGYIGGVSGILIGQICIYIHKFIDVY